MLGANLVLVNESISVNLYSNYINIVWKSSFKHLQMIGYMFGAFWDIHDGFIKKLTARVLFIIVSIISNKVAI